MIVHDYTTDCDCTLVYHSPILMIDPSDLLDSVQQIISSRAVQRLSRPPRALSHSMEAGVEGGRESGGRFLLHNQTRISSPGSYLIRGIHVPDTQHTLTAWHHGSTGPGYWVSQCVLTYAHWDLGRVMVSGGVVMLRWCHNTSVRSTSVGVTICDVTIILRLTRSVDMATQAWRHYNPMGVSMYVKRHQIIHWYVMCATMWGWTPSVVSLQLLPSGLVCNKRLIF